MLHLIDGQTGLYVDDSMIMMLGEEGIESSFTQIRIMEGIKKGRIFDQSFKKGKKSLLLYPSGQAVITHVSAAKIEKLIATKSDELRQLRLEVEVLKLRLNRLTK